MLFNNAPPKAKTDILRLFLLLWIQGKREGKSKLRLNLIREERGRK